MNVEFMPVLFNETGGELLRLHPFPLKKEAEAALKETILPFAYAEIRTIYTPKGGEAVER